MDAPGGRWLECSVTDWRRVIAALHAEGQPWLAGFVALQLRRELDRGPSDDACPVLAPLESRQQATLRAVHARVVGTTVTA